VFDEPGPAEDASGLDEIERTSVSLKKISFDPPLQPSNSFRMAHVEIGHPEWTKNQSRKES
jgi:phenylpropionate dioxygenase-like ring-hydroxylating dioxygenase large terminal subunit